MLDAKRLLEQFMGGQGGGQGVGPTGSQGGGMGGGMGGFLSGAGGGVLAGGLAALLMGSKTGRKIGGEALKLGGMAAVGALAYKAYNDWQAGKQAAPVTQAPQAPQAPVPMLPAPSGTPFNPSTEAGQQTLARHLLRAMIAAAKADGHVDAQEQARIFAEHRRPAWVAVGQGPSWRFQRVGACTGVWATSGASAPGVQRCTRLRTSPSVPWLPWPWRDPPLPEPCT